jgi:hypothetical protein
MSEEQLLKLKKDVETAKTTSSQLTGQKTAILKQLKDDWQCESIEEAETKLQGFADDITAVDKKILDGVTELKTKYNVS